MKSDNQTGQKISIDRLVEITQHPWSVGLFRGERLRQRGLLPNLRKLFNPHSLATVPLDFVTKIGFPTTATAGIGDNESIQIWHVEQP